MAAVLNRVSAAAAQQDFSLLLTPEASCDAADLAAATDATSDLDAAAMLGLFHWCRFLSLRARSPAPRGFEEERSAAFEFFAPVYRAAPGSVPELVRDQYLMGHHPGIAPDPTGLNDRAVDLANTYRRGGDIVLLDTAVSFLRIAVEAVPGDRPERAVYLSNLTAVLRSRFERSADIDALKEAVVTGRAAVAATPAGTPERASALTNLSGVLQRLFERTADGAALAEAVRASVAAVHSLPADHAALSIALSNLRGALLASFNATGDVNVLDQAANAAWAAADASPPGHPDRAANLSNLAITLTALSKRSGDEAVLTQAVEACREAVRATPEGHPDRARYLSNLGMAMRSLYERTGNDSLLTETADTARAAVDAMPEDHPDRAVALSNLGTALHRVFERTGDVAVLTEAVNAGRAAVDATSHDHPDRAKWLSNLGIALIRLFERSGDVEYLRDAAAACRAAVDTTPPALPDRAIYLSNLGAALRTLFERTGDVDILVEAVQAGRFAVDATPTDHPDRAARLSNLASALRAMADHDHDDDPRVVVEAVEAARLAVDALPSKHPDTAPALSNLGIALRVLSEQTGDVGALEKAVEAGRQAAGATSEDHPDRAVWLVHLAGALRALSEQTGDDDLAEEANDCFTRAAANAAAAVTTRIHAYRNVARRATDRGRAVEALSALEAAVELAQLLAPRSLGRLDREHRLGRIAGLASDTAAAAVAAGRPARAVELLEHARGMLVAHRFDIGDDLGRLRRDFPDLAAAVDELRDRLDAFDSAPLRVHDGGSGGAADSRSVPAARRGAYAEWERLMARIRSVEGFEDFLRASRIEHLTAQAAAGPVVFLFTSSTRSGALVLTGCVEEPVKEVELTGLTRDSANQRAVSLVNVEREALINDDAGVRERSQHDLSDHLAWIWDTVTGPVLEALGHMRTPAATGPWPRIWWCPIGILSYLPLHASGHHADLTSEDPDRRANPRTVPDRVVSSYTPTVRSLAFARAQGANAANPGTAIIASPLTAENDALPRTAAEVRHVAALVPGSLLLAEPTRGTVLDVLPRYAAAHFACHGVADINDPAASRLILPDHDTAPLTVADIAALHLTAELAYLSACDTTVTSLLLADEAVHLTGAFHLAGYQNVIGTAWPVNDVLAGRIAKAFYGWLTGGGAHRPNAENSARALHYATLELRTRYPSAPAAWAAYTHTGI